MFDSVGSPPSCAVGDAYCGYCEGLEIVQDCLGQRAPRVFVGDGFCDAQLYLYDGALVDFNCPEWSCDGGDCGAATETPVDCATASPTASNHSSVENVAATVAIEAIQRWEAPSLDVSRVYDCQRSPLSHTIVRVASATVSAVAETGFSPRGTQLFNDTSL